MTLVTYDKAKSSCWLDSHTVKNIQCVIVNIFFEKVTPLLFFSNLPLRAYSCFNAYQEKSYWKIAFDATSLASLYCIGPQASLVVDCASEATNLYLSYKLSGIVGTHSFDNLFAKGKKDNLDCTVRATALKVLGLTEETLAQDRSILDRNYIFLKERWQKGVDEGTKRIKSDFVKLLNRLEISYQTIKSS